MGGKRRENLYDDFWRNTGGSVLFLGHTIGATGTKAVDLFFRFFFRRTPACSASDGNGILALSQDRLGREPCIAHRILCRTCIFKRAFSIREAKPTPRAE